MRFVFSGLVFFLGMSLLAQELTDKQRNLGERYAGLEQILFRLSETSGSSNPRQAALLKKVLIESKDKLLVRRFENLASTLERRQLSDAVASQTEIEQDLRELLKLLENENRNERREEEKEKIKEFLKDLEEILQGERTLKNQTQQLEVPHLPTLEKTQQQIRLRTETLRDRIAEHDGTERRQTADGKEQESQSGKSEQSKSPSGQSEQSESQPGQSEQSSQKQESSPSQRAMQRALERMKQAEQKLKEAEKAGAIEEQEEAIALLQQLKEELERILRQLREEEMMQTLEKLEERFKRMLRQEQAIRSQTERLIDELAGEGAVAPDQGRQIKIKADRLGIDQQSVIDDAELALQLLREDGTAQAMAESLVQARFDMAEVKNRLERTALDTITLRIEDAVIDSLQEMLSAVQTAIEESRQRQENAGAQPPGSGEATAEEPLIQVLAELRMIRSMQERINERTKRYDDEIKQILENPDADLSLWKQAVEELARQQNRISRILHELRIGRTR